jgi:peptidyl-dipeptidase Dcp
LTKSRLLAAAAPAILAAAALSGCTTMADTETASASGTLPDAAPADAAPAAGYTGYFAQPSTLPFSAPDFSKITDADYEPAIVAGIAEARAEMQAIADSPEAPTFQNTIVAMDQGGALLSRVMAPFGQVQGANTNDTLDAIDARVSPMLAALNDDIYLNDKLFQRVKTVYDNRAAMTMDAEDAMLLEITYERFVHAGALLDAAQKAQLKEINGQLATLQTEFSQTLTNATPAKSPVFDTAAELAGLPDADIAAAKDYAEKNGHPGKYQIALLNTQQQPALSFLSNRATREKLWKASTSRTSGGDKFDTRATILKIAKLRAQKAELLGQSNFAEFNMYDRMVKEPSEAQQFLRSFFPALANKQSEEAKMLQAEAASEGQNITLQPWDWGYYAEKVRKKKYDLDEAAIKPYFEVWNVLENGVFFAATKMYGLTFKQRSDIAPYHPSMRVYTVYDRDGSELALFYFDPYARSNKQGGAWMNNFVEQSSLQNTKPVITNTLNITPPADGQPPLATWDDVNTMFHEFGHALHGFFANQKYYAISGTNTARDWVEFPSQFNENFATIPSVLKNYAKHYRTGAPIPQALMDKIDAASKFNQGLGLGETVEAAAMDLDWHVLSPAQVPTAVEPFQAKALAAMNLRTDLIPPRYDTTTFRHIWSNGYSAGYYAYIWTEMLAHDGWAWVEANGGMTRKNGDHVRATFLGQGHTKDYAVMYRDFTGHAPDVEPMLEARGLAKAK